MLYDSSYAYLLFSHQDHFTISPCSLFYIQTVKFNVHIFIMSLAKLRESVAVEAYTY